MDKDGWCVWPRRGRFPPARAGWWRPAAARSPSSTWTASYYAIDNTCSHRGGPLGEGDLRGHRGGLPLHAWRWDVTSGANVNNPAVRVACFAARVQDGAVFVQLGP